MSQRDMGLKLDVWVAVWGRWYLPASGTRHLECWELSCGVHLHAPVTIVPFMTNGWVPSAGISAMAGNFTFRWKTSAACRSICWRSMLPELN